MRECLFFFNDYCVTENNVLILVVLIGIAAIMVGAFLYQQGIPKEDLFDIAESAIYQKVATVRPVKTDVGETFDEEGEDLGNLQVGEIIFAGENEGLGARLEILEFDESRMEVTCGLWIEAPIGSKRIRVQYQRDSDYEMGSAVIEYEDTSGNSHNIEIGLYDQNIYDSPYTLVIETIRSTFEDIREG